MFDGGLDHFQQPIGNRIDPTVEVDLGTACPSLTDHRVLREKVDLGRYIPPTQFVGHERLPPEFGLEASVQGA